MKKITIIALMLALPVSVFATDQFLETCLKIGENRDKKLAVAKEQISLSRVRVLRAGRSFLPVLLFQRKFSRGETKIESYEAEELGLRVSQPFFEGGKLRATYRYERFGYGVAELNYTKFREELFYKAKSAYYELLTANMEQRRLRETFEEIKKLEAKCRIEYTAKAISDLDLQESLIFSEKVENMYRSAEMNSKLAEQKLIRVLNINSLDDIIFPLPEGLVEYPPEISFTLEECRKFIRTNNIEMKISDMQIMMASEKKKVDQAKVIPKVAIEGTYGQSGEAFVSTPLELATVWTVAAKLTWGLWGNSLEVTQNQEKTIPRAIMDTSVRTDTVSYDMKFSLFDDLNYFVESRESDVSHKQAIAENHEILDKALLELEKFYNEYKLSLWNARTAQTEVKVKERKLGVLRKKNELYEASTMEVMDGVFKVAESVNTYTKALSTNYVAVCEMEKLTLMPLR